MGARELVERVAFEEPVEMPDGQGGVENGWAPRFECRAAYQRLRGSETVQAARLAGRQPTVIRVRSSEATREAGTNWRIVDQRTGETFNIRSSEITADRKHVEFLAESGVAV